MHPLFETRSANGIGKEGACHIARALEHNTTLKNLSLHGNVLKDDGPRHIAKALLTNNVLEFLDIDGNEIGPSNGEGLPPRSPI